MRKMFDQLLRPRFATEPSAVPAGPIARLQTLRLGQSRRSDNGRVILQLDKSGRLAVLLDGKAAWRAPVAAKADRLILQNDGQLSLWMGHDCLWSVGKPNRANVELRLQDDGNVVLYDENVPVWWSGTRL